MGISQLVNGRVWGAQSLYADEGKYNTCIEIGINSEKYCIIKGRGGFKASLTCNRSYNSGALY